MLMSEIIFFFLTKGKKMNFYSIIYGIQLCKDEIYP